MFAYLETLKLKPGHVRERIAFGTAAGMTAIVAVGWIAVVATSGTFALAPMDISDTGTSFADTRSSFNSLLGAVGSISAGQTGEAPITVETQSSTTANTAQPTVIPF